MRSSLVFYLSDFRFHGFYQLCELFFAFLSCLGVYVFGYAFAVHSRREPSFVEVVVFAIYESVYPSATKLKTSANNATVSQRPTTVMYCEKPFPVSAKASAPAAPALP